MRTLDWKKLLGLLVIAVGAGVLWQSPYLQPAKVFVVFLHESGHALAALASGGEVREMRVLLEESGMVLSAGGSPFWTLMAGYLGSLVFGGVILVVSSRTPLSKSLAFALGVGMVAITVLYMRNASGFFFGLGFGAALVIAGLFLPRVFADWILRGLGLVSCLYAIYDITSDVLLRPEAQSDARMLAEYTSFPPFLSTEQQTLTWGILWILVALIGTWFFLALALRPAKSDLDF